MEYIAIINEEMLSNFRIDEPPCYMPEDDKILVVKDELGYTRGIQLKPLPKGHGRLIDADAFRKKVCTYQQTGCGDCKHSLCCPEDEPTIIEADKESE